MSRFSVIASRGGEGRMVGRYETFEDACAAAESMLRQGSGLGFHFKCNILCDDKEFFWVNSDAVGTGELADLLRGMQCHVNLIPLNEVKERNMKGVSEDTVKRFMQVLEKRHISVTRRREMGDDIEGACGQLRRKIIGKGENLPCESST